MAERLVAVLDVGKTNAKLSLWRPSGRLLRREVRSNIVASAGRYLALDAEGIENWLAETLSSFAADGDVGAIIPVAHGAAAAIIKDGALAAPVMDYEFDPPDALRQSYCRQRGAFDETGSPAMALALNIGLQLHCMEAFQPDVLAGDAQILPWAQYWAWLLSGVAVSEVSSWGAHTDLWAPTRNEPSTMATRRGWADRFASRAKAGDAIGRIAPEWAARTGLKGDVVIYAGVHDSNAALCAARSAPMFATGDSTLISTGTWFVSMRALGQGAQPPRLAEDRGCLFNVDVTGRPSPTALFMGGRELELLGASQLDAPGRQADLMASLQRIVDARRLLAFPTMAAGTGFFPNRQGGWRETPSDEIERDAAAALYAALMIDVGLDLIGATRTLLVEGRFANCLPFVSALAALRPEAGVFASDGESDVAAGALRLIYPDILPQQTARQIAPLVGDVMQVRQLWRQAIDDV